MQENTLSHRNIILQSSLKTGGLGFVGVFRQDPIRFGHDAPWYYVDLNVLRNRLCGKYIATQHIPHEGYCPNFLVCRVYVKQSPRIFRLPYFLFSVGCLDTQGHGFSQLLHVTSHGGSFRKGNPQSFMHAYFKITSRHGSPAWEVHSCDHPTPETTPNK